MRLALVTLSCICMAAALCEQLLDGSRYLPTVRMALGFEIAAMAAEGIVRLWKTLNG